MNRIKLTRTEYTNLSPKDNDTDYLIKNEGKMYLGENQYWHEYSDAATTLRSIAVTTNPTKMAYEVGETLDLTGIVVTGTYFNGNTADITSSCTFNPANGSTLSTVGEQTIIIGCQSLTCTKQVQVSALTDCLCFTANVNNSSLQLQKYGSPTLGQNFQYKTTNGWQPYTLNTTIYLPNTGDKVYFRGNNPNGVCESITVHYRFYVNNGSISASGNVMSLVDNGACTTTTIPNSYCFALLFNQAGNLTTPPTLPATTLTTYCYYSMFNACNALTIAPELPALTMQPECYWNMFKSCTSLTTPPALPATTLAKICYCSMFEYCTALTSVPAIPEIISMASDDTPFITMFKNCTSLQVSNTQTSEASYAWTIPSSGTMVVTTNNTNAFQNCLGTRANDNLNITAGASVTYYTQNAPV